MRDFPWARDQTARVGRLGALMRAVIACVLRTEGDEAARDGM